jgi:hypothetical protein
MAAQDEIIRAYDEELGPAPPHRNRGFWVIAGVLVASGIFVVVEILAHLPLNDAIGRAQQSLRRAAAAAEAIRRDDGGFASADAAGIADRVDGLTFRRAGDPSTGRDDVSVSASERVWAAAAAARPEGCFYVRLEIGEEPRYGAGAGCTGEAALAADQPRW